MKHGTLRTIARPASSALALATGSPPAAAATTTAAASTHARRPPQQPGKGKPAVTIGTKNFTEQFVLGAALHPGARGEGLQGHAKQNIGSSEITDKALTQRPDRHVPRVHRDLLTAVAGDAKTYPSVDAAYAAAQDVRGEARLHAARQTPFSDSDALAVKPDVREKQRPQKRRRPRAADQRAASSARRRSSATRETGLSGLKQVYGIRDLDVQAAHDRPAVQGARRRQDRRGRRVHDRRPAAGRQYVVLEDPKNVFGFQNVAPVVSQKVLDAEGPAFADTLNAVSAQLTTRRCSR